MDTILIKDLEVYAYHGVFPEEQTLGQKFYLSFALSLDLSNAAAADDLNHTVDYGAFSQKACDRFRSTRFRLLETAAEDLCQYLLDSEPCLKSLRLTVKKPDAPIPLPLSYAGISMERGWHDAYVGLGTNLGNREKNIADALKALGEIKGIRLEKTSSLYETAPWGKTDQPDFLNGACFLRTTLEPEPLLQKLLEIENTLGRLRREKWGPRIIDLDLLFYDRLVYHSETLTLPHPLLHRRNFVLAPLRELIPHYIHPVLRRSVDELYEDMKE